MKDLIIDMQNAERAMNGKEWWYYKHGEVSDHASPERRSNSNNGFSLSGWQDKLSR